MSFKRFSFLMDSAVLFRTAEFFIFLAILKSIKYYASDAKPDFFRPYKNPTAQSIYLI